MAGWRSGGLDLYLWVSELMSNGFFTSKGLWRLVMGLLLAGIGAWRARLAKRLGV